MKIPQIHPDTIEEIRQSIDIVEIVSERVILKSQGKDFLGLCPFHDEKTPSFSVSSAKGVFYCFGCHAGGDGIQFLQQINQDSFSEVVLDLGRRYQIPIRTLEPDKQATLERQLSRREKLHEILAVAAQFYHQSLYSLQGKHALDYLRSRGLSDVTIQSFQLGYAPPGWDNVHRVLCAQDYSLELIEKAGLIIPRPGESVGYYDRFRDRIMIPIRDQQGHVIAFGGRALGEEQPKYLNSPETELFSKGKTLFALDKARSEIIKRDQVVVVEGYFDVITLHAAGFHNVVATLGTAFSLDQVRSLMRFTPSKNLITCFDSDFAGVEATKRAIGVLSDLAYEGQIQLRVLSLPGGKDPDDLLRSFNGKQIYEKCVNHAPLWIDWQIRLLVSYYDLTQADQFQKAWEGIVEILRQINHPALQDCYLQFCAELLALGDNRIVPQRMNSLRRQIPSKAIASDNEDSASFRLAPEDTRQQNLLEQAEIQLLRVYLHCPEIRTIAKILIRAKLIRFRSGSLQFEFWRQIREVEAQGAGSEDFDLVSVLQSGCSEPSLFGEFLSSLLTLNDRQRAELKLPQKTLESTIALIQYLNADIRSRNFLFCWRKALKENDSVSASFYQEKYYEELSLVRETLRWLPRP